ncbi:hypothetical protein ASC91_01225 [Pelomonas sp. Root1237]|nr:hypothetical protein ASC91_01225 [Pelomonas sp. Root1237]
MRRIVAPRAAGSAAVAAMRLPRASDDKDKESKVDDFRAAMAWLMLQAESAVGRQRYKGLGVLRVQIDDAIEADKVFTMLMGDEVEPRRDFIETNALRAGNIDV